jgi:hypothetical protein
VGEARHSNERGGLQFRVPLQCILRLAPMVVIRNAEDKPLNAAIA